VRFLAINKKS